MSGLENTFYIMAIIFMSIVFLLLLATLAAVLVIRAKVNAIHARVEERLGQVTGLVERGSTAFDSLKKVVDRRKG